MRHRSRDLGDTPWVRIAVIVGIVAVVVIAVAFFLGGGSGSAAPSSSAPSGSSSGGSSPAASTTKLSNTGAASITVKATTPVKIPSTGTFVEVNYIGSYKGTYGTNDSVQKTQNSGDHLFEITGNGTISAQFQKMDSSAKHDLTVQIWKDGKVMKFASNSSGYGIARVQYP